MAYNARPRSRSEEKRLKELGLRIRQTREKLKLTLEQIEERGYPSWKHLQAVECGKKNLTITTLFRLAQALGVTAEKLISGLK